MSSKHKRRLEALEANSAPPGRIIVWYPSDGTPEPEIGPSDVLMIVNYVTGRKSEHLNPQK